MERKIVINIRHTGEVEKIEKEVKKFITPEMNGLDIGSAGMPILLQAVAIDVNVNGIYSDYIHLKGDARSLYWFQNSCMDYVFSSHCLEDFTHSEKLAVLKEWIRVLKVGGLLLLYLPNEQKYRQYMLERNKGTNRAHKEDHFDIEILRNIIAPLANVEEFYAIPDHGDYCFFVVYQKIREE